MANNPTTALRFLRLRDANGSMGHVMSALVSGMRFIGMGFEHFVELIDMLAQGRIVSISRGSPPPKKR